MYGIDLCLIKSLHEDLVSVDGGSWGIQYSLESDVMRLEKSEHQDLEGIIWEIGKGTRTQYSLNESKDLEFTKYNLIFYMNTLNGNQMLRYYIEDQFGLDLRKFKSTNVSNGHVDNFIPLAARINPEVRKNLPDLFRNKAVDLIFESIEDKKKKLDMLLNNATKGLGLTCSFEKYVIGSIEINLDIPHSRKIDLVTSEEVGLRLSRLIGNYREGYFADADGQPIITPYDLSSFSDLALKRLFRSNIICGVPCYYGTFRDQTELFLSSKEIPNVAVSNKYDSKLLDFSLVRAEWRLSKNARITNAATKIKEILGGNSFSDLATLKASIDDLRSRLFHLLKMGLNAPFQLTHQLIVDRAKRDIEAYCPSHPDRICNLLLKPPGRINVNSHFANKDELYRAKNAEVFIKPDSYNDQDYSYNWDRIFEDE